MCVTPDPEHHPRQLEDTDLGPGLPETLGEHEAGHSKLQPLAAGQPDLVGHQRPEAGQSINVVHTAETRAVARIRLTLTLAQKEQSDRQHILGGEQVMLREHAAQVKLGLGQQVRVKGKEQALRGTKHLR